MRSILVATLVFTLAFVPAAQAQQAAASAVAEPAPSSLVQLSPHWSQPDSPSVPAVAADASYETPAAAAMREPSARTLLAIVGAAVLVIAVVALVR
jgi:hypothetical protein